MPHRGVAHATQDTACVTQGYGTYHTGVAQGYGRCDTDGMCDTGIWHVSHMDVAHVTLGLMI